MVLCVGGADICLRKVEKSGDVTCGPRHETRDKDTAPVGTRDPVHHKLLMYNCTHSSHAMRRSTPVLCYTTYTRFNVTFFLFG